MSIQRSTGFPIPPFKGWVADQALIDLAPGQLRVLENFRHRKGYLRKRDGIEDLGLTGTGDRIMYSVLLRYESETLELVIIDPYLARRFNGTTFRNIMPTTAATGSAAFTIAEAGADPKKRIIAAPLSDIDQFEAGDFIRLSPDPSGDTIADAFTRIASVSAGSHATLAEDYRGATFDSAQDIVYVKKEDAFNGALTSFFHGAMVLDFGVITNGSGSIWTVKEGAAMVKLEDLASGSGTPVSAKYVVSFGARLYLLNSTGDSKANQIQYSGPGTINKFAVVDGGGKLQIRDDEFEITGGSVRRGNLVIYKERAIQLGRISPDPLQPVDFSPNMKLGTGLIAPNSLIFTKDFDAFLGADDFYIFDGSVPIGIGNKFIREEIFELINYDKLGQVYGFADALNQELIWLVPEGGNDDPVVQYVFNYSKGFWSKDTFAKPRTAMTRFFSGNQQTLTQLQATYGSIGAVPGTFGSYAEANERPFLIIGHADGTVSQVSATKSDRPNDENDSIPCDFITGEFQFVGQQMPTNSNRPSVIMADDLLLVDQIDIHYKSDQVATITVQVSNNGGGSWNTYKVVTLPIGEGSDEIQMVNGEATGRRFMFRVLHNSKTEGLSIRSITPYINMIGKV